MLKKTTCIFLKKKITKRLKFKSNAALKHIHSIRACVNQLVCYWRCGGGGGGGDPQYNTMPRAN